MEFDFGSGGIGGGFIGPRGPGDDATRSEQVAAALALLLLPFAGFCIVLFAELWKHGLNPLLGMAMGLSLAGFVIVRLLSQRTSFVVVTTLQSVFWNCTAVAGGAFGGAILSVSTGFS